MLIGATWYGLTAYNYRYGDAVLLDTTIRIYPETEIEKLSEEFQKIGIVKYQEKMVGYYNTHIPKPIKAGNYRLSKNMSYRTLLLNITQGRQTPVKLTFNNIRTLDQLAQRVSKYTMAEAEDFKKAFRNDSILDLLGMTPQTLPALFLPNTYEIYWTITPNEFIAKMKEEYDDFWGRKRISEAEDLGFSPVEISTIASIVIEETKATEEMTDVAGVYINRLRKNMPLQADPTVKFAIGDFSIKRVLNKHLKTESPYNTYKNSGLPPGPICISPGQVIDAVLDYEGHDYYYFCAKADFSGRHAFAQNLAQHNRNAREYQNELNRRKIR